MNLRVHRGGNSISSSPDGDYKITAPAFFHMVLQGLFETDDPVAFSKGDFPRHVSRPGLAGFADRKPFQLVGRIYRKPFK